MVGKRESRSKYCTQRDFRSESDVYERMINARRKKNLVISYDLQASNGSRCISQNKRMPSPPLPEPTLPLPPQRQRASSAHRHSATSIQSTEIDDYRQHHRSANKRIGDISHNHTAHRLSQSPSIPNSTNRSVPTDQMIHENM